VFCNIPSSLPHRQVFRKWAPKTPEQKIPVIKTAVDLGPMAVCFAWHKNSLSWIFIRFCAEA
jgi:hypothetical protein